MYIKVEVTAGARKESVTQKSQDSLAIAVCEKAERNMANRRVLELVRQHFGSRVLVKIISGHHSPRKIISLDSYIRKDS